VRSSAHDQLYELSAEIRLIGQETYYVGEPGGREKTWKVKGGNNDGIE